MKCHATLGMSRRILILTSMHRHIVSMAQLFPVCDGTRSNHSDLLDEELQAAHFQPVPCALMFHGLMPFAA